MTLAEILAALERRAAEAEAIGATAPVANVYRAVLEDLRPMTDASGDKGARGVLSSDRLLTVGEAAALLGVSVKWLYRHAGRLPFARRLSPKVLRFSEVGLRKWTDRRT